MGSLLLVLSLAMAGCQGDKGPQGDAGPAGAQGPKGDTGDQGAQGPAGENAFFTDIESCSGCHASTLADKHALAGGDAVQVALGTRNATTGAQTAVPVEVAANGTDLIVRFNVKVNGVNRIDFIQKAGVMRNHNEDAWWYYDATTKAGIRTKFSTAAPGAAGTWSFVGNGNGNYTATLYGMSTLAHAMDPGTTYMLSVMGPDEMTATVVARFPGALQHDAVSNDACTACHGNHVWRGAAHDVTSGQGVDACVVCHNRDGAIETRLTGYVPATTNPPAPATPPYPGTAGTGLMGIVHGVHNSKNMPDGTYTWVWPSNGNTVNFQKGFPGNMPNCQTCHQSDAQLAAVMAAPISYALCISCHDSFAAFPGIPAFHNNFTPLVQTTNPSGAGCTDCHPGATAATFHNGLVTERAGLIWDGKDQSIELAKSFKLDITGVTVTATGVEVTWTVVDPTTTPATPYDPCNQDFGAGPVFLDANPTASSEGCTNTATGCRSNFSFVRAYGQADDWVNDALTGSSLPGQPAGSTTPTTAGATPNTTCDANHVATTNLPLQTTAATRGIVALQGKAQVRFGPSNTVVWVRNQSPAREFVVASGDATAADRRQIVDVNKCNACHYGTLYQHGGNRVDKMELCVMCHNPASSEQNRRVDIGVTAAEAYDGLAGQTYDMRTMVHAIHAAGETKVPLMFYRTNGIYFFGAKDPDTGALLGVKNWPDPADCVSCVDAEDGPLTYCKVFGSIATGTVPEANPDGTCKDTGLATSTDGTWRPHRVIEVHYPRALNDCSACHVSANPGLANPTQAVAVTLDAGVAPWNNLLDDVLVGPSTQSCLTCHKSSDPAIQFGIQVHAFGQGWIPTTFDAGRQTLIDAASAPLLP